MRYPAARGAPVAVVRNAAVPSPCRRRQRAGWDDEGGTCPAFFARVYDASLPPIDMFSILEDSDVRMKRGLSHPSQVIAQ